MDVFVTGGTGFIGSHLVDELIENEKYNRIKCLVRNREKWLKGKPFEKISGDLQSVHTIEKALEGVDIIFHIAAIVKAPTQKEFDFANVEATENLLRIAERAGVHKIVVLSSLAAAGPSTNGPLDESAPMKPISMYGKSKKRMEEMIHQLATDDMSVTILRPPAVYGPREDQIYTLFKMMNYGVAPIVGDGEDPKLSLVYVKDVIQAILKAAEIKKKGVEPYFVSGDKVTNWNEIRDIVTTVMGKKNIALKLKPSWVKSIAGAVETTASFFGTYPVINKEKANEMVLEWTCSDQKARKELQYLPKYTLEEGISRTLRWYKKHEWL